MRLGRAGRGGAVDGWPCGGLYASWPPGRSGEPGGSGQWGACVGLDMIGLDFGVRESPGLGRGGGGCAGGIRWRGGGLKKLSGFSSVIIGCRGRRGAGASPACALSRARLTDPAA